MGAGSSTNAQKTNQRPGVGGEKELVLDPVGPTAFLTYAEDYGPMTAPPDGSSPFQELPRELVLMILTFVDEESLSQKVKFLNKRMYDICKDNWLWQQLAKRDYPQSPLWQQSPSNNNNNSKCDGRRLYFQAMEQTLKDHFPIIKNKSSCLLRLHGRLYEVDPFLGEHPGGEEILKEYAVGSPGEKDATQAFEDVGHSFEAKEMLNQYLVPRSVPASTSARFYLRNVARCQSLLLGE
ncbi:Cytochrome b5 type B (outer mitochondrial membrane) [Balamuthia mandrillaris]